MGVSKLDPTVSRPFSKVSCESQVHLFRVVRQSGILLYCVKWARAINS